MTRYEYTLVVEQTDEGCTAVLGDEKSPLRGYGETPLQAVRALCETIREWPHGGSDRWLGSEDGKRLASQFGVAFSNKKHWESS